MEEQYGFFGKRRFLQMCNEITNADEPPIVTFSAYKAGFLNTAFKPRVFKIYRGRIEINKNTEEYGSAQEVDTLDDEPKWLRVAGTEMEAMKDRTSVEALKRRQDREDDLRRELEAMRRELEATKHADVLERKQGRKDSTAYGYVMTYSEGDTCKGGIRLSKEKFNHLNEVVGLVSSTQKGTLGTPMQFESGLQIRGPYTVIEPHFGGTCNNTQRPERFIRYRQPLKWLSTSSHTRDCRSGLGASAVRCSYPSALALTASSHTASSCTRTL